MKRIQSLDLARGFTVLLMPSIHVAMLYSKPDVQQSWLGNILAFIAEYPGAQVFMLLMGVSFNFSRHINPKYVLKRAITLLLAAYVLNFFKFIIPLFFDGLPKTLLLELHLYSLGDAGVSLMLIGDILHFASVAYILIYLVSCIKHFHFWAAIFAMLVTIASPLFWDIHSDNSLFGYTLRLIGGHPPEVFFPIFPWLTYPLAGLSLGYFLKRYDAREIFNHCIIIGGTLIIISFLMPINNKPIDFLPFYRTMPKDTLLHLGFVLMWLATIHLVFGISKNNGVSGVLIFCSKNITTIYSIQWIMICWGMALTGHLTLSVTETFLAMFIVTSSTIALTKLVNKFHEKNI